MASQLEVMPRNLQLSAPPTMPQARTYLFKQQSDLQEYDCSKGNRIRINIPRLQRTYLTKDSYLRFRLNIDYTVPNVGTANVIAPSATIPNTPSTTQATLNTPSWYGFPGVWFDRCGAYGLFDRIEVYDYLGGTLLEQTANVASLVTMLTDLTTNHGEFGGTMQAVEGFGAATTTTQGVELSKYITAGGLAVRAPSSGAILIPRTMQAGTIQSSNFFHTVEFAIPVLSFLGSLSDKYVPLHNGFSIDFYLNNYQQALISRLSPTTPSTTSAASLTFNSVWLSNVEYCAQVLELGDSAEQLMLSTIPQVIHTKQYRYFTDTFTGGSSTTFGLQPNLNVVSLRNLLWGFRPLVYQNSVLYPAYGHRMRNFVTNWNFQYGSSYLPELAGISCRTNAITIPRTSNAAYTFNSDYQRSLGYAQAYRELVKVIKPINFVDAEEHNEVSISQDEYRIDTVARPFMYTSDTGAVFYASTTLGDSMTTYVPCSSAMTNIVPIPNYASIITGVPSVSYLTQSTAGKFMGGINLRLSDRDVISGIDTNGLSLNVNLKLDDSQYIYSQDAIFDLFAEYDAFVQVIPGVATTVTF